MGRLPFIPILEQSHRAIISISKVFYMNLLTSKVTWGLIALFIVGGCEQIGLIPSGIGDAIIALLGIGTLTVHNTQISQGRVK